MFTVFLFLFMMHTPYNLISVFEVIRNLNGLSYSKLMHGLKLANIDINRKMLAEMAVNDAEGFTALAEAAKAKLA